MILFWESVFTTNMHEKLMFRLDVVSSCDSFVVEHESKEHVNVLKVIPPKYNQTQDFCQTFITCYLPCNISFKIFPRFWLVKTTARIIHHNQLLLTKYCTNDVKSTARCKLLNRWHQDDVISAARYRLLNRCPRKPGDKVVLFLVSRKTKSEMEKLL